MDEQKTITMTGKEVIEKMNLEVAAETLIHLKHLTEEYQNNLLQIFKTYMPEMAFSETAIVLSFTSIIGQAAVILGDSKSVDKAVKLINDRLHEQG